MSERLPYEDQLPQHLRDFPLPDENAAWDDMKRRLDEDDNDVVMAWWRTGCAGWAALLLIIALLAGGWWFFNNLNKKTQSEITTTSTANGDTASTTADTITGQHGSGQTTDQFDPPGNDSTTTDSLPDLTTSLSVDTIASARKRGASMGKAASSSPGTTLVYKYKAPDKSLYKPVRADSTKNTSVTKTPGTSKGVAKNSIQTPIPVDSIRNFVTGDTAAMVRTDKSGSLQHQWPVDSIKNFVTGDTLTHVQRDSIVFNQQQLPIDSIKRFVTGDTVSFPKDSLNTLNDSLPFQDSVIKIDTATSHFFFSAGVALNQQLPVAGQKLVPYSSQGREFSLADYIPSVYFRLTRRQRWFLQGEFRYGAPQYNKPITYFSREDTTGGGQSIITERQLQKTYYHQLPVSFNIYLTPDWAVGGGFVWNRFSRSVFEQSVRDPQSAADSFISKGVFVSKEAATQGLSGSYLQALIESQYQWKKFSFGARYTFGLQPYLRFTLPGEAERKERNQSLQVFIRYQLWNRQLNKKE